MSSTIIMLIHYIYMLQVPHRAFGVALCAWPMATNPQRVELKYGIPTSGIRYVMIPGIIWMQLWYAGNLGTMEQPMPVRELILVEDQEVSFWII